MAEAAPVTALDCGRFHEHPVAALVPGLGVSIRHDRRRLRVVEELVTRPASGATRPTPKGRLAHALQRQREGLHMRDFPRHQELQGVFGPRVVAKNCEPLIDDLGTGFRGILLRRSTSSSPSDLQVSAVQGLPCELKRFTPAAACDRDQGVGLGGLTIEFGWFEMHPRQASTISRWLSSSVPISIRRSLRSGSSQLRPGSNIASRWRARRRAPELSRSIFQTRSGSSTANGEHGFLTCDTCLASLGWER